MYPKPIERWKQEDLEYHLKHPDMLKDNNDGWSSMQLTKILIGLVAFTVFGIIGVKIILQLQVIINLLLKQ
jgi:hypothetical protein